MEKAEPEINEEAIPGMEVVETTSSEHAGDADHAGENNDEPSDEQSEADEQEEPEIQPSQASKGALILKEDNDRDANNLHNEVASDLRESTSIEDSGKNEDVSPDKRPCVSDTSDTYAAVESSAGVEFATTIAVAAGEVPAQTGVETGVQTFLEDTPSPPQGPDCVEKGAEADHSNDGTSGTGCAGDKGTVAAAVGSSESASSTSQLRLPKDLENLSTEELLDLLHSESVRQRLIRQGVPVREHLLRWLRDMQAPARKLPRARQGRTQQRAAAVSRHCTEPAPEPSAELESAEAGKDHAAECELGKDPAEEFSSLVWDPVGFLSPASSAPSNDQDTRRTYGMYLPQPSCEGIREACSRHFKMRAEAPEFIPGPHGVVLVPCMLPLDQQLPEGFLVAMPAGQAVPTEGVPGHIPGEGVPGLMDFPLVLPPGALPPDMPAGSPLMLCGGLFEGLSAVPLEHLGCHYNTCASEQEVVSFSGQAAEDHESTALQQVTELP